MIAGGERAGKSYSAANELIARHHLGTLFWIVAPDYKLCRPEFQYLVDYFSRLDAIERLTMPVSQFQPMSMVLKGGIKIETVTARDPQKLAGQAPDGILACEAAQLDEEIYYKMLGRLSEKDGWLWMSGTFEHGSYLSWYSDRFEKWAMENNEDGASFAIPTWSNRAIYPGGLEDPKIIELRESSPNPEWFLERYAGIPCPPPTAVFKEFKIPLHVSNEARFRPYRLDAEGNVRKHSETGQPLKWEVELAIDPGFNGAYSVLAIQIDGPIVYVIDEVYRQYTKAEDIIAEVGTREWWPNVKRGVIDIAGTQHQGLASHQEVWMYNAGLPLESVRVDINPGIARLRTFLAPGLGRPPRLYYSPKCRKTIQEFKLYQYREIHEGKITSEKPIDSFNHSAKALAYWLVARYGFADGKMPKKAKKLRFGTPQKRRLRFK